MVGKAKKIRRGFYNPKCPDIKDCHNLKGKTKHCRNCEPGIWLFVPQGKAAIIVDDLQVFGYNLRKGQNNYQEQSEQQYEYQDQTYTEEEQE